MTAGGALALVVAALVLASLIISALVLAIGAWLFERRRNAVMQAVLDAARADARAARRRAMYIDVLCMAPEQLAACSAGLLRRAELPTDVSELEEEPPC